MCLSADFYVLTCQKNLWFIEIENQYRKLTILCQNKFVNYFMKMFFAAKLEFIKKIVHMQKNINLAWYTIDKVILQLN